MIAVSSSGERFDALAGYLEAGHSRREHERVAWSAGRNLPTDDPATAAVIMRATAAENRRVQDPMYHLVLSAPAGETVDRARLEQIADRVLRDLGLEEHQALLVAHRDKAHAHVHLMVNRVHPETGRAWSRWQDQPRIQRALREMEHELGLTPTPGRLYQRPEQLPPERPRVTRGEQEQAARTGATPLVERAQARLGDFRDAVSWRDLEERLGAHGLRIERRGQGLVITDGDQCVKASRVARDVSLRRLEERLGVTFDQRQSAPDLPVDVARLARDLRVYERLEQLHAAGFAVETEASAAAARRDQLAQAIGRAERAHRGFEQDIARVYRDPAAALTQFRAVQSVDAPGAAGRLRDQPEAFGALAVVERRRLGGLWRTADDTPARAGAVAAATSWRDVEAAERAVFDAAHQVRARRLEVDFGRELSAAYRDPQGARAGWDRLVREHGAEQAAATVRANPATLGAMATPDGVPTRATRFHATEAVAIGVSASAARTARASVQTERPVAEQDAQRHAIRQRLTERGRVAEGLPQLDELRRTLAAGLTRLAPPELARLHAVVTAPQVAIATRLRSAARTIALGHEEGLGR